MNVDFDVYRVRTRITEAGSKVEAGLFVDKRDRETRRVRWERLDKELTYQAPQLDRDVVAVDQIRTVIRTFRDKLFTKIFPGRREVRKTLIYAKDDSHADDIVQIVREVFAERTKASSAGSVCKRPRHIPQPVAGLSRIVHHLP